MPKSSSPSPPKRVRLSLKQLAYYDDVLTDALVDNAYYWNTIRKNKEKYSPGRKFKKDEIRDILFDDVVCENNSKRAEERLLQTPGFRDVLGKLGGVEQEHFKKHLRKYIAIWQTDCPWEVGTTNRYTVSSYEAAALARRPIQKGEIVKYLCGTLVLMTKEDEKEFDLKRKDFSIVRSSRRKASALFLGPARFSNHDCNANAALNTRGTDGMVVVATRNIQLGEEITVTYGDDYFGIDNCECLCHTCEQIGRNGWAPAGTVPSTLATVLKVAGSRDNSTSSKRKRESVSAGPAGLTPEPEALLTTKKRKFSPSPLASRQWCPETTTEYQRGGENFPTDLEAATITAEVLNSVPVPVLEIRTRRSVSQDDIFDPAIETKALPLAPKTPKRLGRNLSQPGDESSKMFPADSMDLTDKIGDGVENVAVPAIPLLRHEISDILAVPSSVTSRRSDDVDLVFDPNDGSAHSAPSTPPSLRYEEAHNLKQVLKLDKAAGISKERGVLDESQGEVNGDVDDSNDGKIGGEQDGEKEKHSTTLCPDIVVKSIEAGGQSQPVYLKETAIEETDSTIPSFMDDPTDPALIDALPSMRGTPVEATTIFESMPVGLDSSDGELSELASDEELDDTRRMVRKMGMRTRSKAVSRLLERTASRTPVRQSIEHSRVTASGRYPGDYVLTKELLGNPGSMWVTCFTCDGKWVQNNAHETRRECPRCERHSIMYGYIWPKTVMAPGDPERIRDHRTINRILARDDQKSLRRRQKGVETPSTSVSRTATPIVEPPPKRGRGRPRGRKTRV